MVIVVVAQEELTQTYEKLLSPLNLFAVGLSDKGKTAYKLSIGTSV